jgi:hypothetical protein
MKTKTSLLAALVAIAGSASLTAQVYSLNVVGYVNKEVPAGFSILGNPLQASTNTLNALFPTVAPNSLVYLYRGGSFQISFYGEDDFGNFGWEPNHTVNPGEGFWFYNQGAQFTQTFVGEVVQGNITNALPAGLSIRSSIVPQSASLDAMNFPASANDLVYFYRNGSFATSFYGEDDFGNFGWEPAAVPGVAEGFWYNNTGASKEWVRTFNVN